MVVDVVSSRVRCANDFLFSFFFTPSPPRHYRPSFFLSFFSLFFFFLSPFFFACAYVQWRPWTDDHVHIAAVTAEQMRERERERTQCAQLPPPLFRRLILFLSFFFFFCTLPFSLCMYTYVFTIRRRCRRREEKDELLAHMQAHRSAHFASTSPSKKQLQLAQKKEKELFSLVACVYVYVYICVRWCDSYIDALPSATICFWTNQRCTLFLLSASIYIHTHKKNWDGFCCNQWLLVKINFIV